MIYPVLGFGNPILREVAKPISKDYPHLHNLIADMFETMYKAKGVGLAAPQIGIPIRLFIVDAESFADDEEYLKGFKKIFINPQILKEEGTPWYFNEGCLSIPGIREDVKRPAKITLKYQDENFQEYEEDFEGIAARIIQHEYDHIEGKLFVDHLGLVRRRMLQKKLNDIMKGNVKVDYKMKFANKK